MSRGLGSWRVERKGLAAEGGTLSASTEEESAISSAELFIATERGDQSGHGALGYVGENYGC